MAESSPLEAAAMAAYHTSRGVKPNPGWHDLSGPRRRAWRDIARAAIAAYEAEQPAPQRIVVHGVMDMEQRAEAFNDGYETAQRHAALARVDPPWLGCEIPPPGWYCSRESGHEGPCAARELPAEQTTPDLDELEWRAQAAIALAFEGQGEAWSDSHSGDHLAQIAAGAAVLVVVAHLGKGEGR